MYLKSSRELATISVHHLTVMMPRIYTDDMLNGFIVIERQTMHNAQKLPIYNCILYTPFGGTIIHSLQHVTSCKDELFYTLQVNLSCFSCIMYKYCARQSGIQKVCFHKTVWLFLRGTTTLHAGEWNTLVNKSGSVKSVFPVNENENENRR